MMWKPVPTFFDPNRDEVQVSTWDVSNALFLLFGIGIIGIFMMFFIHFLTFSYIFEMFGFPSLEVHLGAVWMLPQADTQKRSVPAHEKAREKGTAMEPTK